MVTRDGDLEVEWKQVQVPCTPVVKMRLLVAVCVLCALRLLHRKIDARKRDYYIPVPNDMPRNGCKLQPTKARKDRSQL